ncbi:hypothetical protein R1flu_009196 [Riccia fluitans]|uniref:Pentatricopeptide repeat-containing protein n=1 Tax=Riccia fluitans TaxID=41844 RepID=A0ABD1Z1D6_9MARC
MICPSIGESVLSAATLTPPSRPELRITPGGHHSFGQFTRRIEAPPVTVCRCPLSSSNQARSCVRRAAADRNDSFQAVCEKSPDSSSSTASRLWIGGQDDKVEESLRSEGVPAEENAVGDGAPNLLETSAEEKVSKRAASSGAAAKVDEKDARKDGKRKAGRAFARYKNSASPPRPKPFPIASRPAGSVQQKNNTDRREELVNKAVIEFLASSGDRAAAVLTRSAEVFGNQSSLWDQMMKQLERRGARAKALQVFHFLQGQDICKLSEHNYLTIIGILSRDGKLALAREIFDGMKGAQVARSVLSFTALICGYAKQGLAKKALEVYKLMQTEGCEPNIVTYNTLIHACVKSGVGLDKAVELFKELQRKGLKPDEITYNCMINAYTSENRLEEALLVLDSMKIDKFLPNVVTYTGLLNAYGKAGQLDKAEDLFEEMKRNGCAPNTWTYNALLKAYGNEGLYEKASDLYKEMECVGCVPTLYTFNTVLDLYGRGELFAEAENVLLDIQKTGLSPDRVTYNTLIYSYSKAGHVRKAAEVLDKMAADGCKPDLWTYNIFLDATAKHGSIEEVIQLFNDLKGAGHRPNVVSYGTLISMYGRAGLHQEAEKIRLEMSRAGCLPNVSVFSGLINGYAQHGLHQAAQKVFDDMIKAGVRPDVRSYTILMDAYGRAGQCKVMENILCEMEASGFVADAVTYFVLARAFAKTERWNEGLKYFKLISKIVSRTTQHAPSAPEGSACIPTAEYEQRQFCKGAFRRCCKQQQRLSLYSLSESESVERENRSSWLPVDWYMLLQLITSRNRAAAVRTLLSDVT